MKKTVLMMVLLLVSTVLQARDISKDTIQDRKPGRFEIGFLMQGGTSSFKVDSNGDEVEDYFIGTTGGGYSVDSSSLPEWGNAFGLSFRYYKKKWLAFVGEVSYRTDKYKIEWYDGSGSYEEYNVDVNSVSLALGVRAYWRHLFLQVTGFASVNSFIPVAETSSISGGGSGTETVFDIKGDKVNYGFHISYGLSWYATKSLTFDTYVENRFTFSNIIDDPSSHLIKRLYNSSDIAICAQFSWSL